MGRGEGVGGRGGGVSLVDLVGSRSKERQDGRVAAADADVERDGLLLGQGQVEQLLGRLEDLADVGPRKARAGRLDVEEADRGECLEQRGCELLVGRAEGRASRGGRRPGLARATGRSSRDEKDDRRRRAPRGVVDAGNVERGRRDGDGHGDRAVRGGDVVERERRPGRWTEGGRRRRARVRGKPKGRRRAGDPGQLAHRSAAPPECEEQGDGGLLDVASSSATEGLSPAATPDEEQVGLGTLSW